jgi:hypothetical protein
MVVAVASTSAQPTPDGVGCGRAGEGVLDGVGVLDGEGLGEPAVDGVLDGAGGRGVADGGAVAATVGVGAGEVVAEGVGAGVLDALGVEDCVPAAGVWPPTDQIDAGTARKPPLR